MTTSVFLLLGAFAGLGIWIAILGAIGAVALPAKQDRRSAARVPHVDRRVLIAAAGCVVGVLITGWLAGGLLLAFAGWVGPDIVGAKARRAAATARIEAIAVWTEQLRDVMRAAAGLQEAISTTARVAPPVIRPHVAELASRLQHEPVRFAMQRFARSVDDSAADKVVAALILAAERRSANLAGLLSEIAASTRQQATLSLRIEASRTRTYAQAKVVCAITAAVVAALFVLNRRYLEAYDTATGQLVLCGIGSLFTCSALGVIRLGTASQPERNLRPKEAQA